MKKSGIKQFILLFIVFPSFVGGYSLFFGEIESNSKFSIAGNSEEVINEVLSNNLQNGRSDIVYKPIESTLNLSRISEISLIEQIFTIDTFNITLFIYNRTYDGINAVSISIYWNGTNVSSSMYEIGNGYYMISINPIFTAPGEPGITLETTIIKNGYEQLIYSSEIAVDPETVQKNGVPIPPPGAIPWSITAILLSTFLGIVSIVYYFKKRIN